ncbi:MAG: DNA-binding response regulator [Bacteroidetes bacterium]|nr:MAG: DNA-binding response regulator [Bacteroidota bacterium]
MRILIIEDEQATANRLKNMVLELRPDAQICEIIDSIEAGVEWYKNNEQPDLVLQDIQLSDGSSFDIFEEVKVEAPIIFITAFDEFAIQAFKLNSVDYLLKPVKKDELERGFEKFREIYQKEAKQEFDYASLAKLITKQEYQKRFVVRFGQTIKAIAVEDIAYFFSQTGGTFFKTFEDRTYPIDMSLDKLEPMLDPLIFFRINRQFIVNFNSIKEMYSYSKSRVKIELKPSCEFDAIASTDRSGSFKKWLSGKPL